MSGVGVWDQTALAALDAALEWAAVGALLALMAMTVLALGMVVYAEDFYVSCGVWTWPFC